MTREEAIGVLRDLWCFQKSERYSDREIREVCEMSIKALKERQHGEWIFKHNSSDIWCSNCDENFDEIPQKFLFCPNCGADMREGDKE